MFQIFVFRHYLFYWHRLVAVVHLSKSFVSVIPFDRATTMPDWAVVVNEVAPGFGAVVALVVVVA
jgi:hypothetical protein